eukprot:gnl/TRDRNA2_/TRDRNA2_62399_c0_seq1.p1 gnl/TRDRNA2_/TRDRNA2_62399_c0~~gnl/TRDRNA2_/TRDRNA2_62399_c0_seq1.p1  ORF type:complete len:331 (+),score=91.04 gnl/TRDRNA2_/TRDRNA2_62399_c0_seq1:74-994(+)
MEADDLDNLIADSLDGVQSALETERKEPAPRISADTPAQASGEAVRKLQQGPSRSDDKGGPPNEEFFANLVKSFQDENFQKAMESALQGAHEDKSGSTAPATAGCTPPPAISSSAAGSKGLQAEDFLQNFMKSFEDAVGNDSNFEQQLSTLMTSMLSNDLICEPLQQIVSHLEPWLEKQKHLPSGERGRYEAQLRLYRKIIGIYKENPDPLPDEAREEVQRLLGELHALGQPPEEVMRQVAPKDPEDGGESFEDFMKSMGLADSLGAAEQDLVKKLAEDPEELTKVMKEMTSQLSSDRPDEACKQQ